MHLLPSSLFYLPQRCSLPCVAFAFWQNRECPLGVELQSYLTSSLNFMATKILSLLLLKSNLKFLSFLFFLPPLITYNLILLCIRKKNEQKTKRNYQDFRIYFLWMSKQKWHFFLINQAVGVLWKQAFRSSHNHLILLLQRIWNLKDVLVITEITHLIL